MWCLIWFPNRRASGRNSWTTLALLLLLATTPSAVVAAQPATESADAGKPVLLAVRINGIDSDDIVPLLLLPDGRLAVPEASLRAWRLTPPAGGKTWFRLDDIDGVSYRVDAADQTLLLQAPPSAFAATTIASGGAMLHLTPSQPGGFINYDLQWLRSGGRDSGSGLFELGAFNATGSGTATALWNSASLYKPWVRLDTTWNFDMPERMQSLRLGDAIGRAGTWGRAVRFGGVQWGTNFATQPNFITFPLPTLRGEAALPSTFDVYADNVRRLHGDVPPGPFDLPSVPVITGQGQIQLVVRDLLGRQQVITQPYYASQRLLQPGLHDFSYEAGAVRENYGIDSASYGRFMLAATDRLGISPEFTRELRAEVLREQRTLGAGGVWLLPSFGTASLAAAISHGPNGGGRLFSAGVERQAKDISFGLQTQYAERNFVQIGLIPAFAPRRILSASLGVPVGGNGLGVGYLQQSSWQGDENRLLSANYSLRLGERSQLGFYALRNFAGEPNLTVGVMLTLALDERTSASANVSRYGERNQSTLQVQRNLPAGNGFGYRLLAGQGQFDQLDASAAWRTERGDFSAEAMRFSGSDAYRAGFSGGVAVAGGGVFLSRRIVDSFAVVKVDDYPDVRVYRDNQEVTRTDRRGLALITSLRAYQENPIGIEQADLPLDAEVDTLQFKLTPALRSGVVAAFPVRRSRAATFRLVGGDGRPVPAGTTVRLEGQDKEFPVGYEGKTFVTGLAPHNRLLGEWNGRHCAADLDFVGELEPMSDLGTVICKGVTR
jgi:outer membrane usher protein